MDMRVDVNITGKKELEEAIKAVEETYLSFTKAAHHLMAASLNLGVEINQTRDEDAVG